MKIDLPLQHVELPGGRVCDSWVPHSAVNLPSRDSDRSNILIGKCDVLVICIAAAYPAAAAASAAAVDACDTKRDLWISLRFSLEFEGPLSMVTYSLHGAESFLSS